MSAWIPDFRFGSRVLTRSPAFAILAAVMLAIGLGANAAIFSITNEMLLHPYPFPELDRLVTVRSTYEGNPSSFAVSQPNFEDLQERNRVFEGVCGLSMGTFNLTTTETPVAVTMAFVSPNLFEVLGVRPVLGRTLGEAEARYAERVAMIDEGLWRRIFAADPEIVGRSIELNGELYPVVGVVPSDQRFPAGAQVWVPPLLVPSDDPAARGKRSMLVVARLGAETSPLQLREDIARVSREVAETYPEANKGWSFTTISLAETRTGQWRQMLFIVAGIVFFILMISCANVGSLLIERATVRRRELAIRIALGAGRPHLIRLVLGETLVLAALGGGLGLLFTYWFLQGLLSAIPSQLASGLDFGIDLRVFVFMLMATLVAALLAGVLPALHVVQERFTGGAMKEGSFGAVGGSRQRLRRTLVIGEIAVSFILLVGAGILVRSFLQLQATDPGCRLDDVLVAQIVLPVPAYEQKERRIAFYGALLERMEALPGIDAVSAASSLPFLGWRRSFVHLEGKPEAEQLLVGVQRTAPGYFRTLDIPLPTGRPFTAGDHADAEPVALVSAEFVRRFWGEKAPLGRRIKMGREEVWRTVVGVVGDVRHFGFTVTTEPDVYLPYDQAPSGPMLVFGRTSLPPATVISSLRDTVHEVDPKVPVIYVLPLESGLDTIMAPQRTTGLMITAFGIAALVLATAGIYGFVAYAVAQRRREIGVRMALGARLGNVVWLVVRQTVFLVGIGIGIGLVGAGLMTRLMSGYLFEVAPFDPASFAAVVVVFTLAAGLAGFFPARQAARVDPVRALHYE